MVKDIGNIESKPDQITSDKYHHDIFLEDRSQDLDYTRNWEKLTSITVKGDAEAVLKALDTKIFSNDQIPKKPIDFKSCIFFEENFFEISVIPKKVFEEADTIIIDYSISFANFFGTSPRILIRIEAKASPSKETSLTIGRKIFYNESSWFSKSIEKKLKFISDKLIQDVITNINGGVLKEIKPEGRDFFFVGIFLTGIFLFAIYYLRFFFLVHHPSLIREVMDKTQSEFEGISKIQEKFIKEKVMGNIKQIETQLSFLHQ